MSSAQLLVHAFLLILFAQSPPQSPTASKAERIQMKQEDLCCFDMKFVKPTYPREARLARTEGIAKLKILIADDNSIAEIQPVSGDPCFSILQLQPFADGASTRLWERSLENL